ncbi:ABC transporter substrate-binding protein [Falsiroseomonas ponticola]|uniref:ABC transporter substrate-binding protein n=1 Tax=Falsiroseomonas ponticola TaxID=2786951 RepID=UPI001933F43F|nr:ABC transporter substrate-binding protein [Roseomonas ponticola]
MQTLNVVAFAGASNLALWAGTKHGVFARHGLEIALSLTPNSKAMASDLHAGCFDLALTAVDNIVAYDEGQGEVELPGPADFVAWLGVDDGMLNVMAVPGIADIAALRGRRVAVDAMTTGFAFVLREILGRAGIADTVEWVAVGGGAQRLAALVEGAQEATLLNTPLDLAAEAKGCLRLARAQDVVGPYQGIVAASRRAVLAEKRAALVAFARAFRETLALLDADHAEAAAILAEGAKMPPPVAARAVTALLDPLRGITRDLSISEAGLATVLRLRSHFTGKALTDPSRYLDPSIRAEAFG